MTLLAASRNSTIRERLADELVETERRVADELTSEVPCVRHLVQHIERYRGKRMRPMLLLVAGMATSPDPPHVTDSHRLLAAVVEMVHMATLVHDDVLDDADVRRRGSTINHLRGNEAAVMLGDYMISHAYHLCSNLGNTAASRAIAQATNAVCEGELLQLANRDNWHIDEATYFNIIRHKTASLCGTCCRLGADINDAPKFVAQSLYDYGENLGMAFQIVDDLLDLTGSENTVGKTLGCDLAKGKLTLPLIHHLAHADAAQCRQSIQLIESPNGDNGRGPHYMVQILRWVDETGSVDYASGKAVQFIRQAQAAIEALPESAAKALLMEMADAVVTRRY